MFRMGHHLHRGVQENENSQSKSEDPDDFETPVLDFPYPF